MKTRMFEVVPLAEVIDKLDDDAARKIRGDSAGKEELPEIPVRRPHSSVNQEKTPGPAHARRTRPGSRINHG